ncbi:MAG: alkaline phosphatase family protein [Candidatus Dormibacteraceae bacterium]
MSGARSGFRFAAAAIALAAMFLSGCASSTAPPKPSRHVFVIVMENKSPEEALSGAFTASLASSYGEAANYRAVAHPSVPNYLALTSGSTWGLSDDSYHVLPQQDIGDELTRAGVSWRAYMDGLGGGGCLDSPVPYDPGHNPFAYYGGACPANVVPLTSLAADLSGKAPLFTWITPDMCHDEHSCDVSAGDSRLRQTVGMIITSKAWSANGVLFVVWDEDDGSADNRVLSLVVTPHQGHHVSHQSYNHYSLLATIEDLLGVGRLGQAAGAKAMTDLVAS